jgi:hypothetical protein
VWFGERRLAVQAITDRWYGTDRRWWKLQTAEGLDILRRDDSIGQRKLPTVPRSQSRELIRPTAPHLVSHSFE